MAKPASGHQFADAENGDDDFRPTFAGVLMRIDGPVRPLNHLEGQPRQFIAAEDVRERRPSTAEPQFVAVRMTDWPATVAGIARIDRQCAGDDARRHSASRAAWRLHTPPAARTEGLVR